jgi:uncharacterized protein (DUF1697 family)
MRYVGLLRAVNVGKRQVSMAKLRELVEALGHTEVQTLLQSGNVVFDAPRTKAADLEASLSTAIEAEVGFPVPVLNRTGKQLDAVIDANPFPEALKADPKFLHVAFASAAVPASAFADVDRSRFAPDDFAVGQHELYLWYANGSGRSKMDLNVPGVRHIDFTARNWNTVVKLRDLASGP